MDRKALTREYKQNARPMGVFRVRNLNTGRWLIGTSVDLPAMLNRQRAQLKLGAHPSKALQKDWNALGPDAFAFETLDTLEPPEEPGYDPTDDLATLKALWIERQGSDGTSY